MLNPECVDYSRGKIKIVFTDDAVDHALTVYLTEDDAFRLGQMLIDKTNYPAREKRRGRHDPYLHNF
jgi:hypothetical protein